MGSGCLVLGALLLVQVPQDPVAQARVAVAAAESKHGVDSLEVSDELLRLTTALQHHGQAREALPAALRLLAIREARLPRGHQRTAQAMVNVGTIYCALDEQELAFDHLQRARQMLAALRPGRVMLAALVNLGACEIRLGRYLDAARTLEAAVAHGREHAPDHPGLAGALQNLAQVRLYFGEVEAARALIEVTLSLLAKTEPEGPRYAHAVFSLGIVFLEADRLQDAEPLLRQGLELRCKALGADSDGVGDVESHLGQLEKRRGNLAAARRHFERALAIAQKTGNLRSQAFRHAELSGVLLVQGEGLRAMAEAEAALAAAAAVRLAPGQQVVMRATRAQALASAGEHAAAAAELRIVLACATTAGAEANANSCAARSLLAGVLRATGDHGGALAELRSNLALFGSRLQRALPALREHDRLGAVALHRADLDHLLELSAAYPELMPVALVYREVLAWKGQVARGLLRQQEASRRDPEGIARLRRLQQIASELAMDGDDAALRREQEHLETLLGRTLPLYDDHADAARIATALPAGTALVDYLLYRPGDSGPRYVAFVVRAGKVERFELGPANAVAQAVDSHVQLTARSTSAGAARLTQAAAVVVRQRVWDPVAAAVHGCEAGPISPDQALALLPFETLPGARAGSYLVEEQQLGYLQNGLDLLRPATPAGALSMLALGEIDYGAAAATANAQRGVPRPFPPLPAVKQELTDLAAAFGSERLTVLRGSSASEPRLRQAVAGTTFVHLATHGFFGHAEDLGAITAGVALAGANAPAAGEDGILTADEASFLDLGACRLVVLSACQSGLGQPFAGESLLGLRRALHVAGARATLTSLWRVDDTATALLMADFYRALFREQQPVSAALRQAQLRAIERARAASGEGLPGLWGAFVLEGRP